jgi:hypothetical protein
MSHEKWEIPQMPKMTYVDSNSSFDELLRVWEGVTYIIYHIYNIKPSLPMTEQLRIVTDGVVDRSETILNGSLTGIPLETQNLIVMLTFTWLKLMTGFVTVGPTFLNDSECISLLNTFGQLYSGQITIDYKQKMFISLVEKTVERFGRVDDTVHYPYGAAATKELILHLTFRPTGWRFDYFGR